MNKNRTLIASTGLLLVAFVWGSTFVLVQQAVSILPPFSFNFLRFFLAGLLLFLLYLFGRRSRSFDYSILFPGIVLGFFLFLGFGLQTIGLLHTTPARAGFITGLNVVIVPFLALSFSKKRPSLFAICGAFFAAVGLYLLAAISSNQVQLGDILVLGCAVAFAAHIFLTDRFAAIHSALLLAAIQLLSASLFSFVSMLLFEDSSLLRNVDVLKQPEVFSGILITALFATAAAFFLQTWAQQFTSSTRVAVIFAMEPVFAALSSFLLIGEVLSAKQIIGCLFIFFGMMIVEIKPKSKSWLHRRDNFFSS
ncbi:DMT family transporter [Bacillus sp. 2205SS5-2]|uniref:DMT family transporter n=1 Tax=Bacillus sp. 2205SS5-2 TaxID=3109031 RepID=UPI003005FA4C